MQKQVYFDVMNIKDFKSGSFLQQRDYKSFSPEKINHEWIISSPKVNQLLAEANRLLGELNAFSQLVPDIDFYIQMHIVKEATSSSRIEGTKTNMEDALVKEEHIAPEKKDDWAEVQNYISAINESIEKLSTLPISTRLIRETHKTLMSNVRGEKKRPGEYRESQNWIGATLKDAVFIPPHHSQVDELMNDLEQFIHNDNIRVPDLIKIALVHYQFETIHPFLDGNGRIGRLLITLYLVSNRLLVKPALYLSDFFENNKGYYYDNLTIVRTASNLEQWINFFLVGVIETTKKSIQTFKGILALKDDIETNKLPKLGSKVENGQKLVRHLYQNPIIGSKQVARILELSPATANRFLKQFVELGILHELTGYKRNRVYIFKEYYSLF